MALSEEERKARKAARRKARYEKQKQEDPAGARWGKELADEWRAVTEDLRRRIKWESRRR